MTMSEPASAALHIQGSTLTWAEVGWDEAEAHLHRLGRETFDVNLNRFFWEEETPTPDRSEVKAVFERAIGDTQASNVSVVFSPMEAFSFFLPISEGLSENQRQRQIDQQTSLVTGVRALDSLQKQSTGVRTSQTEDGASIEWVHVVAVPQAVGDHLRELFVPLSVQDYVLTTSSKAAARLVGSMQQETRSSEEASNVQDAYTLAVGSYSTHTEYTLTQDHAWHHAGASRETRRPQNKVYFAVDFLERIEVSLDTVDRIYLYGESTPSELSEPMQTVFGVPPEVLDVAPIFPDPPERLERDSTGTYVPCLGAAFEAQSRV